MKTDGSYNRTDRTEEGNLGKAIGVKYKDEHSSGTHDEEACLQTAVNLQVEQQEKCFERKDYYFQDEKETRNWNETRIPISCKYHCIPLSCTRSFFYMKHFYKQRKAEI